MKMKHIHVKNKIEIPITYRDRLMNSQKQIQAMLKLQDEMNCAVDPNWINNHNDWMRAVRVEAIEMLDHYGWKWWKKQTPDIEQVKLELIDIIHFMLARSIEKDYNSFAIEELIIQGIESAKEMNLYHDKNDAAKEIFRIQIEKLSSNTFGYFDECWYNIGYIMHMLEMDINEVYTMYMGKNILNRFRQSHGYKEGTYERVWGGRDDNEWLTQIMDEVGEDNPNFMEEVEALLDHHYMTSFGM